MLSVSVPCPALPDSGAAGNLPNTGVPVAVVLGLAALLVAVGMGVLLLARGRRGRTVLLIGVLAAGVLVAGPAGRAHADPACPPPSPASVALRVVVEQTSVNDGLAPGVPATVIAGVVRNQSNVDVYVTAVTVTIGSVSTAADATPGTCSPVDYRIQAARMPVGALLHPGGRAAFRGATIGFLDRPVNQDTCRGAVVHLKYVSS